MTLNEIRSALSLERLEKDTPLTGISTDTRTIRPGNIFLALRGENYDGHNYVGKAIELGATAVIVQQLNPDVSVEQLVVGDALKAYGLIGRAWRLTFEIPVIAVTGSVGKTTMKEMVTLAISSLGPVVKTEKNENNEVGAPLTLLRLTKSDRAAIIEMGMRGRGQIRYLAGIARPTVGIVTTIGESHIEILGSQEAIAKAKGELVEEIMPGGTVILNADDSYYKFLLNKTKTNVFTYGFSPNTDFQLTELQQTESGNSAKLLFLGSAYDLSLLSPAAHDILNAAGAVAAAVAVGVRIEDAIADVEKYVPTHMRMEPVKSNCGATILSDCYNAAPTSVISALNTLSLYKSSGNKAAFLGDMRELGEHSTPFHKTVADEAAKLGIESVYTVGDDMRLAFPNAVASFDDSTAAAEYVRDHVSLSPDDVVLVKGSRALKLEKIVDVLVQQ